MKTEPETGLAFWEWGRAPEHPSKQNYMGQPSYTAQNWGSVVVVVIVIVVYILNVY